MLTGPWSGKFDDGFLSARVVGRGTCNYAGWHFCGDLLPYDRAVGRIGEYKQTVQ